MLSVTNRPQWLTIKGGSQEYVKKLTNDFKNKIGDIITLTKFDNVFIISVKSFARRRLNAKEALKLYKEIKIM